MDIEKIKSLIRLANNNPNDNEANLAARKVCKLLAENNFAVLNGKQVKSAPQQKPSSKTHDEAKDLNWEEVMRDIREKSRRYSYDKETKGHYNYRTDQWTDDAPKVYEYQCFSCRKTYYSNIQEFGKKICPGCKRNRYDYTGI